MRSFFERELDERRRSAAAAQAEEAERAAAAQAAQAAREEASERAIRREQEIARAARETAAAAEQAKREALAAIQRDALHAVELFAERSIRPVRILDAIRTSDSIPRVNRSFGHRLGAIVFGKGFSNQGHVSGDALDERTTGWLLAYAKGRYNGPRPPRPPAVTTPGPSSSSDDGRIYSYVTVQPPRPPKRPLFEPSELVFLGAHGVVFLNRNINVNARDANQPLDHGHVDEVVAGLVLTQEGLRDRYARIVFEADAG
jgi:hypothetical protein